MQAPGSRGDGRVAIVTGGSRGLGRAILLRVAERGFAVVVDYLVDQAAAETAVEAVLDRSGAAVAVRADVSNELDVIRLFSETRLAFGGVDAVVHAVGSTVVTDPLANLSTSDIDAMCRLNTRATLLVHREAARHLRPGGALVHVTPSADGSTSGCASYLATKATGVVLAQMAAEDLRERAIGVNAVTFPVDGARPPARVAAVVAELLVDKRLHGTGQVLHVTRTGTTHVTLALSGRVAAAE